MMVEFTAVDIDEVDPVSRAFDDGASLAMEPDEKPRATRRRGRRAGGRAAGAEPLGNLAITGIILLTSFTIGEWANPTEEEAKAIAIPLGNILARRIDIASKLGKDADDTVMLVIALVTWLSRVGPEGVERGRSAYNERRAARAAARVDRTSVIRDESGTAGVDVRTDDVTSPYGGPTRTAFDVDAEARQRARRGFGGDPRGFSGHNPAVVG